ncbi:hypothetical protein BH09BAC2_BH09BAC2_16250 [soil metagenome]
MKLFNNQNLLTLLVLISGSAYMFGCRHENDILPPAATTTLVINHGTNVHLPGNMTAGNATEWKLDKSHSSVLWSTNYVGAAGLLTGRFNQFGIHNVLPAEMTTYATSGQPVKDTSWAFYENEPAKSYFNGYVQVNTNNTGEPGRDNGCILGYFGSPALTVATTGTQNLNQINIARIQTTKIAFDPLSADYIVNLKLTWLNGLAGNTAGSANLVGRLKYIKKATVGTTTTYDVFGLQLTFQFNCRDFGITSTSISDKVEIQCNMNFNNK